MPLRAHGPEPCVSANSTTPAIDIQILTDFLDESQFDPVSSSDKERKRPVTKRQGMAVLVRTSKTRLQISNVACPPLSGSRNHANRIWVIL